MCYLVLFGPCPRSLQWKRGKLLGKGAFGKVWEGLLDSAQMIAVKEVELDIVGQKAQSVSVSTKLVAAYVKRPILR